MLAEFQFREIPITIMSKSDQSNAELKKSPIPTSVPPSESPINESISSSPKFENLHSVSYSAEEVGDETDQNDDGSENSPLTSSNSPIGFPIIASIFNSPKLETQGSVSLSTEEVKKRRRLENESDENDIKIENSQLPSSNFLIGSLYEPSISKSTNLEIQGSVSLSTDEAKKRRILGDEIDPNDDGFTTPTDSDHKIPAPIQCPPAPRKPISRKSKSPPETASENHRSIFSVDVSDEEAESLFPPRVEDELAMERDRRDDDVA